MTTEQMDWLDDERAGRHDKTGPSDGRASDPERERFLEDMARYWDNNKTVYTSEFTREENKVFSAAMVADGSRSARPDPTDDLTLAQARAIVVKIERELINIDNYQQRLVRFKEILRAR